MCDCYITQLRCTNQKKYLYYLHLPVISNVRWPRRAATAAGRKSGCTLKAICSFSSASSGLILMTLCLHIGHLLKGPDTKRKAALQSAQKIASLESKFISSGKTNAKCNMDVYFQHLIRKSIGSMESISSHLFINEMNGG